MNMKKTLFSLIPLVAVLALSGCNNKKSETSSNSGSSSPSSSQEAVVLDSITLSGNYQTDFLVNEEFNHDGLIVIANYSDTSSKEVTNYSISEPNMSVVGSKDVTVTYTEGSVSKNKAYSITVSEAATEQQKNAAIAELNAVFNDLDIDDYSSVRWKKMVNKLNEAIKGIKEARTLDEITAIKNDAMNYLINSPTASQIVEGTWFDHHSADSNYEFDRDDENRLVITYDGYPGHWVYCGTKHLVTDTNVNNILSLTFSNDIDEAIEVCFQATADGSSFKADTGIVNVAAHETKTLTLNYDIEVNNVFFFIDSCSVHDRHGQVTIIDTSLKYEKRDPSEIYDPKYINMSNVDLVKDDDGVNTHYILKEEDHATFIDRVDAIIEANYYGNSDGNKWFGIYIYAGKTHLQIADSAMHAQSAGTGKENLHMNLPLSKDSRLVTGDDIYLKVAYIPGSDREGYDHDITFKVIGYVFHYTLWAEQVTETVMVNEYIYKDGKSKDAEENTLKATVPYSSFTKTGAVNKMEVTFETVNRASYGKSQIYVRGFDFTQFESGNNNVLNIGKLMDTTMSGTPTEGTITVYPTSKINLASEGNLSFECWWASADDVLVKSVKMYTDDMSAPEDVTGLEAHPIDSGIVLEWSATKGANMYEVYVEDDKVGETKLTNYTVEGLTNGQTYTFGVVAKNGAGSSSKATVSGTPVEGAEYDNFIGGLNTDLEVLIGQEGINKMFDKSVYYLNKSNNERYKSKLAQIQAGESTKVLFMGGSITVGETASMYDENNHQKGYAYYTYQWLKKNYDSHDALSFINASISGTGSEIGIVRAQKDVINHNPDIIFIEFAANNGSNDFYKQSYESLIRKCLSLPSNPAVVLLFSATYYTGSTEQYMSAIGEYYGLPMFSLDKGFKEVCTIRDEHGNLTREDPIYAAYSDDSTHPNNDGHKLYAKCLCYFLKELAKKTTDDPVEEKVNPSQSGYNKYESLIAVDNTNATGVVTSLGSFVAANTATPSTSQQSDVTAFQQGWKKTAADANEPMVIEVSAKNLIIIYEAGNPSVSGDPTGYVVVTYVNKADATDTGSITWNVAKTCQQKNSSDLANVTEGGNGWQNPVGMLIFDKTAVAEYRITIQMAETAQRCTIMAFGYSH